jgi:hypothetical protein
MGRTCSSLMQHAPHGQRGDLTAASQKGESALKENTLDLSGLARFICLRINTSVALL